MGVSSTARLPSLGAQSIPPLFSHLQHTSNAKVVARWSITIRSFRAVPVPTHAWPSPDQYDSSFAPISLGDDDDASGSNAASSSALGGQSGVGGGAASSTGGSGSSASGAPPLTKPRTMWQVWLSDHPGVVFIIVEDTGRFSRAKVWKDWEVSTKKWKKAKRQEIEARRKADERKAQRQAEKALKLADAVAKGDNKDRKVASEIAASSTGEDKADAMDIDETASAPAPATKDETELASASALLPSDTATQQQDPGATTVEGSNRQSVVAGTLGEDEDEEVIESAGPRPILRLPSHTRYTVSAVTSSMSAMLTGLNLPPPHGAPVGTAGPGAWVPRGAAVSIEGLVLEINSQSLNALPGISPALASVSTADDAASFSRSNGVGAAGAGGSGGVDWRVRVGSVMGGGGRSAGAIVEAEFLPVSTLLPTSKFMHDFLHSLFPPGLVPILPPATAPVPGLPNQNLLRTAGGPASRVASANGTPRSTNATLGSASGVNGNNASSGNGAPTFSYTIGGSTGAAAAPPNRNFNIPVVSDQLWEEVVPRSGEGWCRRIAKRSNQMKVAARVQRRQRKNAAPAPQNEGNKTGANGKAQDEDAFGWHTFGSDDEVEASAPAHAHANGAEWEDEDKLSSSSDSEADQPLVSGTSTAAANAINGLAGTAVTMQQMDEDDDDDDDDRPLGAALASGSTRNPAVTAGAPANAAAEQAAAPAAAKKEDTVQLIFQGLRPDEAEAQSGGTADEDGWTGIERGRRIAFQYVQMLRAEGII